MKTIKSVHVSEVKAGAVVILNNGVERTVGSYDIKRSSFMGITIFGDNYHCGNKLVSVAVYTRALPRLAIPRN
jgi:hypothetical protein